MKKGFMTVITGASIIALAACGNVGEADNNENNENNEDTKKAKEIYEETLTKAEDMESAKVNMKMDQEMTFEETDDVVNTKSDFDMDMNLDPVAFYMEGNTKTKMTGEMPLDEDIDLEMYMTEDGIYTYLDDVGEWIESEDEGFDELQDAIGNEPNPTEQLEMMEEYIEDFDYEEKDGKYILTLETDEDKAEGMVDDMLKGEMGDFTTAGMDETEEEMLDSMEIKDSEFILSIDKETYDLEEYDVDMEIEFEDEEEGNMYLDQQIDMEYKDVNEVDKIEVPKDVKEDAVTEEEIQDDMMGGFEEEDFDENGEMDIE